MVAVNRAEPVDIERSARGLIRFFGDGAEQVALNCAQKYKKANDAEARETWDAIARAVRMTRQDQSADEPDR